MHRDVAHRLPDRREMELVLENGNSQIPREGMRRHVLFLSVMLTLCLADTPCVSASIFDGPIFINEFHYDNVGADQGEFIEVVAPVSLTDPSSVTLTLYNGNNGASYSGPTALDSFVQGETTNGYTFFTLDVALQNGAPDGLALAQGASVLQFLSYEGTFSASNGVAAGLTSTDVGVFENGTNPLGLSLQLAGSGDTYSDFTWQAPATNTHGALNHGQLFTVPEPGSLFVWLAALGSFAVARWRRTR